MSLKDFSFPQKTQLSSSFNMSQLSTENSTAFMPLTLLSFHRKLSVFLMSLTNFQLSTENSTVFMPLTWLSFSQKTQRFSHVLKRFQLSTENSTVFMPLTWLSFSQKTQRFSHVLNKFSAFHRKLNGLHALNMAQLFTENSAFFSCP